MPPAIIPFIFVVLWASGFIASKLAMPHAEPFTFLAVRFGAVAALLLGASLLLRATWPDRRHALHAMVSGVLNHGLYLGPVFWAIANGMSAGMSALIVSMQPILTALVAPVLVGERVTPRHWLGLGMGIAGVALVLWPKIQEGSADARADTVIAALIGLAGITAGNIYQKKFATGIDLRTGGFFQFLGAALLMLAGFAVTAETGRIDWTIELWIAMLWSVVVMSIGAITLLMVMIRNGAISKVTLYYYLVPPVTALMAYGMFGERLVAIQFAGMILASLAVMIAGRALAGDIATEGESPPASRMPGDRG